MIQQYERDLIYTLASNVREIAERPIMQKRKELWYKHNSLQQTKPMILCFPEGAWAELLPENTLQCQDPLLREWEYQLKQTIFWAENINDDNVVEPNFMFRWVKKISDFGFKKELIKTSDSGSYTWKNPLHNLNEDMSILHFRTVDVDRLETQRRMELADEIFQGTLTPRLYDDMGCWTLGLTWTAIDMIGLEGLMMAMYDNPEGLHRLMKWLMEEHMNMITFYQEQGLLTRHNTNEYVGSGGVAYTNELSSGDETGKILLKDRWGYAESQETVGVSPEMFGEFIFPYQLPLLEKFGLNAYGCCEPLDNRWKYVKNTPNLRRVSVSPWSNQEIMAEYLGKNYVYSRKPNPSGICTFFNEDEIRKDLQYTLKVAGNCNLEVILKDTATVQNEPERITRWVEIAREVLES